jgi:succinate-semialdehyde dehydrogenase/glutarate-semialdehyde dehydrogenase
MKAAKNGEPTDEDSYYGPMARLDLRDELHEQVQTTQQGGRLVGGTIPKGKALIILQVY